MCACEREMVFFPLKNHVVAYSFEGLVPDHIKRLIAKVKSMDWERKYEKVLWRQETEDQAIVLKGGAVDASMAAVMNKLSYFYSYMAGSSKVGYIFRDPKFSAVHIPQAIRFWKIDFEVNDVGCKLNDI